MQWPYAFCESRKYDDFAYDNHDDAFPYNVMVCSISMAIHSSLKFHIVGKAANNPAQRENNNMSICGEVGVFGILRTGGCFGK